MKKSILAFAAVSLALAACQPRQAAEQELAIVTSKAYIPEKTTPMQLTSFDTIRLQAPDTESGDALLKTMKNRRSDREFSSENLSLKHLSEVLWAANGMNREDGKRTVPSAMALYPLATYAVLANGVYLYDPAKHVLVPVVEGDHRAITGLQPFVNSAPLNLVYIADINKFGERASDNALYLAALDAGHCSQNVYLYCASEGLKSVVRAGAQEKALMDLLKLDDKHKFVVAQTVGI